MSGDMSGPGCQRHDYSDEKIPITLKLDSITLRLEMTSDLPKFPYNRVLWCTKVPYDESGFKVPSNQI